MCISGGIRRFDCNIHRAHSGRAFRDVPGHGAVHGIVGCLQLGSHDIRRVCFLDHDVVDQCYGLCYGACLYVMIAVAFSFIGVMLGYKQPGR